MTEEVSEAGKQAEKPQEQPVGKEGSEQGKSPIPPAAPIAKDQEQHSKASESTGPIEPKPSEPVKTFQPAVQEPAAHSAPPAAEPQKQENTVKAASPAQEPASKPIEPAKAPAPVQEYPPSEGGECGISFSAPAQPHEASSAAGSLPKPSIAASPVLFAEQVSQTKHDLPRKEAEAKPAEKASEGNGALVAVAGVVGVAALGLLWFLTRSRK